MNFALVFDMPKTRAATMRKHGAEINAALMATANETAAAIVARGRADITSAGQFGPKWTQALHSNPRRERNGVSITTTFQGRGWRKFQTGMRIQGRPLLWIPLSFSDAKGVRLAKYPHHLVRVDRAGGKPPLMVSTDDGRPKYFGKESVLIPKKFHLVEIAEDEAAKIPARFRQHLKGL